MQSIHGVDRLTEISAQLDVLSEFAANLDVEQLSPEILQTAKACLLYGLAVGVGTRHARPALLATAASQAAEGCNGGPATRLHDGIRTSVGNAVFANAVLLSGRVQGDSHICGHPGGVIIPAALAAIEQAKETGGALLASIVAGYEVALRIGRDHVSDINRRGFRATPVYGVFGAAAAISRARRLDAGRIRNCIGMAVNFAGGLREYVDAGTEESPFQAGFAARNATHIVDLIELGLDAAPSGLSGPAGFYQAYGSASRDDYGARIADELGKQFEFTNLTLKRYPACQFVRAVIRGVAALRTQSDDSQPERIVLRLNSYEANFVGMRFAGPFRTSAQTVMSAPFCAALAWLYGTATFQDLRSFDNVVVNRLSQRVEVIADDTRPLFDPVVTVVLEGGQVLEWTSQADPATDQVSWSAAVEMTYQLYDEVGVSKSMADEIIACIQEIDHSSTIDPLINHVCKATRSDS